MVIASHNPASVAVDSIEIKVPHSNFKVMSFDGDDWVDTETVSVICNLQQQELYPKETINDCNMFVK